MNLEAKLLDEKRKVSIEHCGNHAFATIGDHKYELEIRQVGEGEYLLVDGVDLYECQVTNLPSQTFSVQLRGRNYTVGIVDPKRLRSGQTAGNQNHGEVRIVAPMPGKVVRVLVEKGAAVEAGDGVVVVEAMKMQNEMKAPKAGIVIAVNAATGDTVNSGDVLAVIE